MLPQTDERTGQQISLLISLGQQLLASKGYAHPDVQRVHDRARMLCRQMGRSSQLVPALSGLGLFYSIRAEYGIARELYEQILDAARSSGDLALIAVADRILGYLAAVTGEFAGARAYLEQALAAFNPEWERDWLFRHPHDHAAVCHTFLSWALWPLGYGDQALEHSRRALARAEASSRPIDMAHALGLAAVFHASRHDAATCQVKAEAAIAVSTDKSLPFWEAIGHVYRGWALAQQGMVAEGLAELREGTEFVRASGALQSYPGSLMQLAEALGLAGRADEGLARLEEALDEECRTGSRLRRAELLRLRGELLLQHEGNEAEAEACFLQAIAVAQDQQAKSWELRATLSLYRLWQRMGRRRRSPRPAGGGLRLVHRRVRRAGSAGGEGAARRINGRCADRS